MKIYSALLFILLSLGPGLAQSQTSVTVFAAASLQGALESVADAQPTPKMTVVHSYGGSGTMARQVAAGAPADLVILANPIWMAWLQQQAITAPAPAVALLGNQLALIAPAGAPPLKDPSQISKRLGAGRLAMGQPTAVPAGTYAKQWLETADLWASLQTQIAETDNVRAALAFVARGEAPLGVVYVTDALAEDAVDMIYAVSPQSHDPILYPALALSDAGSAYLAYLQTVEAQHIFNTFGFESLHP